MKRRTYAATAVLLVGCPVVSVCDSGLAPPPDRNYNKRHEHPLHPVLGRLRPCRERQRGVPIAAARCRGMVDQHGAVLEPHRVWALDRAGLLRRCGARAGGRHRGARCAAALRRRAVRLHGRRRHRRGDPARRSSCARSEPQRDLLLRSGDRRCRGRRVCAGRHRGIPARSCTGAGGYRHAQPVRTGAADGSRLRHAGGGEGGCRARWLRRCVPTGCTACC